MLQSLEQLAGGSPKGGTHYRTTRGLLVTAEVTRLTKCSAENSSPVDLDLVLAEVQTHHRAVLLHTANKPSEGGEHGSKSTKRSTEHFLTRQYSTKQLANVRKRSLPPGSEQTVKVE